MEITQIKKLKINATNIQSSLFRYNKELIKLKKDRVKLNATQQNKLKISKKEKFIETPLKSLIANIGRGLISYPLSLIDKFKEFFGLILLGILVNNLPKIIKGLQSVFKKIKDFLDKNPFIMEAIKLGFKVIGEGIMGLVKLIKEIKPYIGGSFKFALDTIKVVKNQVGSLINTFDELDKTADGLLNFFGLNKPQSQPKPAPSTGSPQGFAQSGGYGRYAPPQRSFNPGRQYLPYQPVSTQPFASGGRPAVSPPSPPSATPPASPPAPKPQRLAKGGTVGKGLGNIPPAEGTFRGGPSDIMRGQQSITTKSSPYASPGGTAKGRKARQSINSFKLFEMNVKNESRNLENQEKNYDMFGEFLSSYKVLTDLRKKYKDTDEGIRRTRDAQTKSPDDYDPGEVGSFASGAYIGNPGDRDGEQTGLNMNLPGGIGTPIYAPRDLVYKTRGTNGGPSVGLQGTASALGPSGRGFGFYGAYFFKENDKEYEVLMGHFRDMPYRGTTNGEIIPKGTLLGYQGASGRSVSSTNGVYPHISLHLNGVGFQASNQALVSFANSLRASGGTAPIKPSSQPGKLIVKGAKATMYNPALGGINASGAKTASGEPATSTGEPYRANVFSAAAFPELLKILPSEYLTGAKDFRGGKTLKKAINLLVVDPKTGKRAIIRVNDVGPGVRGHAANHMLDLSVAAQKYFGPTNQSGLSIYFTQSNSKPGPVKPSSSSKPKIDPQNVMNAQTLRTNIANLMKDLGTNKKIFGQKNLSVELVGGQLEFKDTRGILGTGLLQQQYNTQGENLQLLKDVQNYLQYELNKRNEERRSSGASSLDYGGAQSNNDLTIIKEPIAYIVPGPPQTIPVPVDRLVPVPVSTESDYVGFYNV